MTAYTTKMDETDQWFEEKTVMVNIVFLSLIQIVYQVGYFVVFVVMEDINLKVQLTDWKTLFTAFQFTHFM